MSLIINALGNHITIIIQTPRVVGDTNFVEQILNLPIQPETKEIIFDFSRVEYINSLGMAEIVAAYQNFIRVHGKNIKWIFTRLNPSIAKVLKLVDLGEIAELRF